MKYRPLFTLQLRHAYYTDGRCPDFTIQPAPETSQLLKNHRCILKTAPDGITVNIAVNGDDKPFIALTDDKVFTFRLRLQNSNFPLFTQLDELEETAAPVYTNNGIPPENRGSLLLASRQARGQDELRVVSAALDETFVIGGKPQAGSTAGDFLVGGISSITSPSDFDAPSKAVTVDTRKATAGDTFQITYPIEPSLAAGVFAEIEILSNDSLLSVAAGPSEFFVDFSARQARWRYYLVSDRTEAQFLIKDSAASALVFASEDLNQNPDERDAVSASLRAQFPKLTLTRFESDAPVALHEKARSTLQLCSGDQRLVAPLPNPALRNITQSTRSSEKETALYQVIKYITSTNHSMGEQ